MPPAEYDPLSTELRRPAWNEAPIWMGASTAALVRILAAGRCGVSPLRVPGCLVDLALSTMNSAGGICERIAYGRSAASVELAADPVFIVGHWRTGTTWMHEMLARDSNLRAPTTYECMAPHHFLCSQRFIRLARFTLPRHRGPDRMPVSFDLPQEDEFALCNLGVPSMYRWLAFPNQSPHTYDDYLELDRLSPDQRDRWSRTWIGFLKRVVRARPGRLLLKSPQHTFRLPWIAQWFSRAKFVHMVRDPHDVYPSTVRLWKSLLFSQGYQRPIFDNVEPYVLATFARMHERLENTRAAVEPNQICDVRYEDLVGDPPGQLRRVYETLDLGDFDEARPDIDRYLASRADHKVRANRLPDALKARIDDQWCDYQDRWGYHRGIRGETKKRL